MNRPPPNSPVIAFFDFDNTLICDDSQGLEIRYLMRQRRIRPVDVLRIGVIHWLYKHHQVSSDRIVRACVRIYRGLSPEDVREQTAGFHKAEIRPRYVPAVHHSMAEHVSQGHVCVILSASVPHLLEPAAKELGVDHMICTRLEIDTKGKFTGRPDGPVCLGAEKTMQAKALAHRLGSDLSTAWAYTDHHADTAFLSAVGNPVAVNPTPRLRKTAEKTSWDIMDC
ncbi:MAG: HAD-IB family hydrolase [Desulfobacterales bacterium]|nr:HAD-IB family hydrolase [Desulfobacterales bacterium]